MKKMIKRMSGPISHRILALLCLVMASTTVHATITPEETALRRLMELSETPTQAAMNEVLSLANEGSTFEMRHQFIFTAMTRIGPSAGADAYAKSVLDAGAGSVTMLRGATAYLTEHADASLAPYATKYLDASRAGEVRCMAAYLAGMLGLTVHKDTVSPC